MYAGFVLESEPSIPELQENYVMVFRPMTPEELGRLFEDRAGHVIRSILEFIGAADTVQLDDMVKQKVIVFNSCTICHGFPL